MKDHPEEDIHDQVINTWEKNNFENLTINQKVLLLQKAMQSIESRALKTLSSITLMVILDRVLHQSKIKFPILSTVKIENHKMSFAEFALNNHAPELFLEAHRFLLTEQLRVLGRITADILTEPLHQELLKVTWNEPEQI